MYKTYISLLIITFSLAFACNNSSKYNQEEEDSSELKEDVATGEVGMEELRNQAIALKDTLNDKIRRLDSLMVDKNVSETSELTELREKLVKKASEVDTVIYRVVNANSENWSEVSASLKSQLKEVQELIQENDTL